MNRRPDTKSVGTPDYMPEATSCVYGHAPMISSHDTQLDMDIIVSMFIQYQIQVLQIALSYTASSGSNSSGKAKASKVAAAQSTGKIRA